MEINKLIIILIIVLIFFACILFIIKRNSKIQLRKLNFNISGGSCKSDFFIDNDIEMPGFKTIGGDIENLPTEILEIIPQRWPSVGVLVNQTLQKTPLDNFYYSEKTDGLHMNLLIYDGKIYDVTKIDKIHVVDKLEDFHETLIIDTEFYNNKYYIFDAYYIQDECINELSFLERMEMINVFVKDLGDKFEIKTFSPIPSIEFLINFIKNDISPITGNEIDGVILQRIDRNYLVKRNEEMTVFKMKPRSLMTLDLLMKYQPDSNNYKLYTIGTNFDYLNCLTSKPKLEKTIYGTDGKELIVSELKGKFPKSMYILFDSSFYPNMNTYENHSNWNTHGFFKRNIDVADHIIKLVNKHPDYLNNKIVEMAITDDHKFVPIRIRDDKETPNGFKIVHECISVYFDQIKPLDQIYFQKDIKLESYIQTYIHDVNKTYRRYVIEKYINPKAFKSSIIDLCGGRGADVNELYINGITNFFAIDQDSTALKQYVDRSYNLKRTIEKIYQDREPLVRPWKNKILFKKPAITVNALKHSLTSNYENIINDLNSRFEFKGSVDFVIMNFAIHYLCNNPNNLIALSKFVSEVLNPNGIFICSYYNGDEIVRRSRNNLSIIGPFEIKFEFKNKHYRGWLPLPTFKSGDDIYDEEPLAMSEMLDNLNNSLQLIEEINAYDITKKYIDQITGENEKLKSYLEYYKLVTFRIYKPKVKSVSFKTTRRFYKKY